MKFIYFDCIGGASGDMLLASFIDGLVPLDYLKKELSKTALKDYEIKTSTVSKHHLNAKKIDVISKEKPVARHLSDIKKLVNNSSLNKSVKDNALKIFTILGEQEAKIHNIPLEKIHFHEVGAIDSIIDIVGSCICIDYLKPDEVYTSDLPVSYGTVKAAHGTLPVPAPATLAILQDYPVKKVNIEGELVTPTGAAIIKHFSSGLLGENESFKIEKTGYGAGSKDLQEIPNILRTWLCHKKEMKQSGMFQIETTIDDMNPEIYPWIINKLLDLGVNDAWYHNVIMKHGRPGNVITILSEKKLLKAIKDLLFKETTTIGFRFYPVEREILNRKIIEIDSPWGKIKAKEVTYKDMRKIVPEYRESRRIAEKHGISVLEVNRIIENIKS